MGQTRPNYAGKPLPSETRKPAPEAHASYAKRVTLNVLPGASAPSGDARQLHASAAGPADRQLAQLGSESCARGWRAAMSWYAQVTSQLHSYRFIDRCYYACPGSSCCWLVWCNEQQLVDSLAKRSGPCSYRYVSGDSSYSMEKYCAQGSAHLASATPLSRLASAAMTRGPMLALSLHIVETRSTQLLGYTMIHNSRLRLRQGHARTVKGLPPACRTL